MNTNAQSINNCARHNVFVFMVESFTGGSSLTILIRSLYVKTLKL